MNDNSKRLAMAIVLSVIVTVMYMNMFVPKPIVNNQNLNNVQATNQASVNQANVANNQVANQNLIMLITIMLTVTQIQFRLTIMLKSNVFQH